MYFWSIGCWIPQSVSRDPLIYIEGGGLILVGNNSNTYFASPHIKNRFGNKSIQNLAKVCLVDFEAGFHGGSTTVGGLTTGSRPPTLSGLEEGLAGFGDLTWTGLVAGLADFGKAGAPSSPLRRALLVMLRNFHARHFDMSTKKKGAYPVP